MADIESEIFEIVARKANIERDTLSRATALTSIKLESIDLLEIMFDIEEKFNVSILYNPNRSAADGEAFATAGDFIDFIKSQVKEGAQTA